MNSISDFHPGKLKRKNKKSPSTSVVDMPALASTSNAGNLLGDMFFDRDSVNSNEIPPETNDFDRPSPLDAPTLRRESTLVGFDEPEFKALSFDKIDKVAAPLEKRDDVADDDDPSPLDLLKPANQDASSDAVRSPQKATMPLRLQKKSKTPPNETSSSLNETSQLNEFLVETRELNQKCVDTLAKLQNINIQNERRYAIYLTIVLAILAVLTVVGVIVGSNLKYNAKINDLKFKQEAYTSAIKAKTMLEAEFEKDKKGSAVAFEIYQKIELGLYEESIERFNEVRDQLTHPAELALLEAKIDEIRWKLAENAYHDGIVLYNATNFDQARDAFFKSLHYKENTSYTPRLYFYIAMSLYQLGDFEGAKRYFTLIPAGELSADLDAIARYHRGICAEKLGNYAEAVEQFEGFLKKYKYHKLADDAAKHKAKSESAKR